MDTSLTNLRTFITEQSSKPSFVHHKWFAKWHLEIVEALSLDMLKFYPEADKHTLIALAWMHDYGKILDFDSQYDHSHIEAGRLKMIELGFSEEFAKNIAESVKIFDAKKELEKENIEIRIVSSADACSHLVGPFISLYWHENPDKPFEEIMNDNKNKFGKEWELKVTIPEAIKTYQQLHDHTMLHANGDILRIT